MAASTTNTQNLGEFASKYDLASVGEKFFTVTSVEIFSDERRQEKMRDREGEQGRWPGYVNFTKVISRSHQTEVCFPRGPPVLGMTSYEVIGACRYGIV